MLRRSLGLFAGNSLLLLGGALFTGTVNYLIRRTLALNLTEAEYGFFYSAFSLCNLLIALLSLGVTQAGSIVISGSLARGQRRRVDGILSLMFFFMLAGSAAVALALFAVDRTLISAYFKYPAGLGALRWFLLYLIATATGGVFLAALTALKDFRRYNLISCLRVLLILAGIWLLLPRWRLDAVVWSWIGAYLLTTLWSWRCVARTHGFRVRPGLVGGRRTIRKLSGLCLWLALSLAGMGVMNNLDTVCLTWLGTLEDVALYNIALPIMQIGQSLMVLPLAFLPMASELWQQRRKAELRGMSLCVSLALLAALPPVALLAHGCGAWLIRLLFSAKFTAAAPTLTILSAGVLLLAIAQFNLNILNAGGRQKAAAAIVAAGALLNVLLNVGLIPRLSVEGAALATAGSYLWMAAATFAVARRMLRTAPKSGITP